MIKVKLFGVLAAVAIAVSGGEAAFLDESLLPGQTPGVPQTAAERLFARGYNFLRADLLDDAAAAFKELTALDTAGADGWLGLADVALRQGRDGESRAILDSLRRAAPEDPIILVSWGNFLRTQGQGAQAEAALKKASRLAPENAAPHAALGNLYVLSGERYAAAAQAYSKAIALEPRYADAHFGLGLMEARQGRGEAAAASLKKAAELAPEDPLPSYHLARLYLVEKKYDQALQALDGALRAAPSYAPAWLARGDVLASKGEDGKALKEYEAASKLDPDDPVARVRLGMVYKRVGQVKEADAAYQAAIALDPQQAVAYNNLANLWVENTALLSGEGGAQQGLDQALAWAQKAVELAPNFHFFKDTLGWVHRARGEQDRALGLLEEAAAVQPQHAEILYHLGVVYAELGRKREAATTLKQALEMGANFDQREDARRWLEGLDQL